jgi:hypothetical protein
MIMQIQAHDHCMQTLKKKYEKGTSILSKFCIRFDTYCVMATHPASLYNTIQFSIEYKLCNKIVTFIKNCTISIVLQKVGENL